MSPSCRVILQSCKAATLLDVVEPAQDVARLLSGTITATDLPADRLAAALALFHTGRDLRGKLAAALHDTHGWTWPQIAAALHDDVDQATVSRWAASHRRP